MADSIEKGDYVRVLSAPDGIPAHYVEADQIGLVKRVWRDGTLSVEVYDSGLDYRMDYKFEPEQLSLQRVNGELINVQNA